MLLIGRCRLSRSETTPNETKQFRILASYNKAMDWCCQLTSRQIIIISKSQADSLSLTEFPDNLALRTPSRSFSTARVEADADAEEPSLALP
jgi:hypothetical protein